MKSLVEELEVTMVSFLDYCFVLFWFVLFCSGGTRGAGTRSVLCYVPCDTLSLLCCADLLFSGVLGPWLQACVAGVLGTVGVAADVFPAPTPVVSPVHRRPLQ